MLIPAPRSRCFLTPAARCWDFTQLQGSSNMTGTNCDLFTHKSSRSYLNHLVFYCRFKSSKCSAVAALALPDVSKDRNGFTFKVESLRRHLKTSEIFYPTTRCSTTEGFNLQQHRCRNLQKHRLYTNSSVYFRTNNSTNHENLQTSEHLSS